MLRLTGLIRGERPNLESEKLNLWFERPDSGFQSLGGVTWSLRGLILGLKGLKFDLRGLIRVQKGFIGGGDGWTTIWKPEKFVLCGITGYWPLWDRGPKRKTIDKRR